VLSEAADAVQTLGEELELRGVCEREFREILCLVPMVHGACAWGRGRGGAGRCAGGLLENENRP
jgi:hypothetical protein